MSGYDLPQKTGPVIMLEKLNQQQGGLMVKRVYTPEQIIGKLREAEIHLGQGASVAEASKKISVIEQTYYHWRKEYGGMRVDLASQYRRYGYRRITALLQGES